MPPRHEGQQQRRQRGQRRLAEIARATGRGTARRHRPSCASAPAVLRVNALATFSLRWLLPRLGRFRDQHPEIEVRLSTSNEPVDALHDPYDVVIRGGPDTFYGFASRLFLSERRLPVCSPALFARAPLQEVADLRRHTLLHTSTLPRVWSDWFAAAGSPDVEPAAALTLDHFYLTIQAALDGLGIAMGPTALVADDLEAGRLVAPFAGISLPTRNYHVYLPDSHAGDPAVAAFCDWLAEVAR